MSITNQPTKPYLLFHPRFILKVEDDRLSHEVPEPLLNTDAFKKPSFAIDVDCRKYELVDVVKRRAVYAWWNLPIIRRNKIVYVDYNFDAPEQLTFEKAREEFIEYVCAHRWWTNSHESEKQFRARNAKYRNMAEVIGPVSLKGNFPQVKRK